MSDSALKNKPFVKSTVKKHSNKIHFKIVFLYIATNISKLYIKQKKFEQLTKLPDRRRSRSDPSCPVIIIHFEIESKRTLKQASLSGYTIILNIYQKGDKSGPWPESARCNEGVLGKVVNEFYINSNIVQRIAEHL